MAVRRPSPRALEADREVLRVTLEAAIENGDCLAAQLKAALDVLQGLVRFVRRERSYMAMSDQLTLGDAKALLVAHGRSVEP